LDFLTLEDGTDRLFRNVGMGYHSTLRNIPEERGCLYYQGINMKGYD
jgi:hypothetical protein